MIDTSKLFTIFIEAGLIISGFILLTKSLELIIRGKKLKGLGILFLAIGILINSFSTYSQLSSLNNLIPNLANNLILVLESLCFLLASLLMLIDRKS